MIDLQMIGADAIAAGLDSLAPRLTAELQTSVGDLALRLTRMIQQDKLSGAVLQTRSGRLQRSIRPVIESDGGRITATVTADAPYAAAHEFGFHGTVSVRQHLRRIRQAFGRPIAEKSITVRAHAMRMNLPERSFLRSALADLQASGAVQGTIDAGMTRAIP
ncbi:HK97 gp10 family phage protein [Sphingomonas sp. MMS24-J13]|uniref:HK97 gp10 family phage protein n=1 Tax=Sphingomonas sp. MMS24-J13 TaxID=3238686 RepID=UPI00384DED4E